MKKVLIILASLSIGMGIIGCTNEEVGTVGGAVAGGAIGSAVSDGSTAGTIGGAVVGGFIGNRIGASQDSSY